MKEIITKYYKVVLAQVFAYGLAWYLVTNVFLGPLPVLSPAFKQNVADSPEKLVAAVEEIPQKLGEIASAIKQRKPEPQPEQKDTVHLPDPFVFRIPTPTPTPYGLPAPTKYVPPASPVPQNPDDSGGGGGGGIPRPSAPVPTQRPVPTAQPRPTAAPTVTPEPTKPVSLAKMEKETLDAINAERKKNGAAPVSANSKLMKAARDHAIWMNGGTGLSRCGHQGEGGSMPQQRAQKAGYKGYNIGEIVACGHRSADEAVAGWMGSPGHRAILIDKQMREIGIGWGSSKAVGLFGR